MNHVNIPKRPYHHGNLRVALVQAALRAIAEDGPDGFTLRDVAKRAGVSPAAPYRHFRDKDELLAAVAAECAERFAQLVAAAVAEVPPGDPLAQLRQIAIASLELAVAHPEHFRALHLPGVASRLPEEQQRLGTWHGELRRALAAAQDAGALAPLPLDDVVLAADSLIHGLGHRIVQGQLGEVSADHARQLAIAATGVLGAGLLPRVDGGAAALPPPPPSPGPPPPPAPPPLPAPVPASRPPGKAPRKGMRSVRPKV